MAGNPEPIQDRQRRLDLVRAEIDHELAQGNTLSTANWLKRYPDLQPELGTLIEKLIASRPTYFTASTGEAEATIDAGSMASPDPAPTQRIEPSPTGEEPIGLDATDAATQAGVPAETLLDRSAGIGPIARAGTAAVVASLAPRRLESGEKVRYIGDYETISVLGQGGMGVVYKARQLSLNRFVALKMIRNAEFASLDQLRRFQVEAEAVAMLDHPGIVPIHEVGTFEDQRYFSMKLVDGGGMDKRLKDLAKDPKRAARIVAEVADAVHHAHQRGILHRDLKPANILIDHHDHAHVTDFGLAKRIDEDAGLTVAGAIMGTPSYMSPEQAAGRTMAVTTASDVYGLGAILYASLTGRAPFAGDSVLNTLDQVRNNPPQPPTRLNVNLDRDLEVICLKCLEKEPSHRYPSAQALAQDLDRWIKGEPIAARSVGPVIRLTMWAKRKPALAGLSAALILGTIIGTAAVFVQWREAVAQRDKAEIARNDAIREEKAARKAEDEAKLSRDAAVASEKVAVEARALAERNAQAAAEQATKAIETIGFLVDQVQRDLNAPGLFDLKIKILDAALAKINGVAESYDKYNSKEALTAGAMLKLGMIYRQLGESEKSFRFYEKSMNIYKERVKIKKGTDASRRNLAMANLQLAMVSKELRRDMQASLRYNQEVLRLAEDIDKNPMLAEYPANPRDTRILLFEAYQRVGVSHLELGEITLALDHFRKAFNIGLKVVEDFKDDPKNRLKYEQDLNYPMMGIAEMSFRLGDRPLAETYFHQALDLSEATIKLKPDDLETRQQLAGVLYQFGEYHLRFGNLAAARANLRRALEERKILVDRESRTVNYQSELALAYYRLGNLADLEGNAEEASNDYRAALKIQEQLWQADQNNAKRQSELMLSLAHVGELKRAQDFAERFAAGPKVDRELRIQIARCYAQIARSTPPATGEAVQSALVRAFIQVESSIREGFRDRVDLETEPDLAPIRTRNDFKQILTEIKPG